MLGRVAAVDVKNPDTGEVVIEAGTLIDEDLCDLIDELGIDMIKVRTPLTCETRYGLCAKCYGRDLGRGSLVNAGESVGVIAGAVDRRAGHAAYDAYVPYRRCRFACRCGF